MENKTQINLTNFERCKDIKQRDVLEFLKSEGYNISNFKYTKVQHYGLYNFEPDYLFSFNNYDELDYETYNHRLVLLGSSNDWKNSDLFNRLNEDYLSTTCNNNPFVRYIYFSISCFKIYEVLQDVEHKYSLTSKLEKDLSKEWVQFLARQKEEYKPSLIQLMIKRKKQAEEDLESSKQHVQNKKAELDKYLEKRIIETNQEINLANSTTEWLEELN